MELNVIDITKKNEVIKKVDLSPEVFDIQFNEPLVHQIVTSYLSNKRSAVKAEKSRAGVSGGGIKPFRQKGTGKARAGSIRSPIWRGGGQTFTANYRNYNKKINKKMYKKAMQCIFSELIRKNVLTVIDNMDLEMPKTKNMILKINSLNIISGVLIINSFNKNLYLSSKNIPNFFVKTINNINPIMLIKNKNIIISLDALKQLEGLLA